MFEYSTAVPVQDQVNASTGDVNALNSFLTGLGALVTPVANVVAAAQAPKHQATTSTGDGQKNPVPTLNTGGASATGGVPPVLIYAGLGLVAILAVVLIAKKS